MGTNKKHIAPEQLTEWLASTGFLFPSNEIELARFEKLFGDSTSVIYSINYDRVLSNVFENKTIIKNLHPTDNLDPKQIKMVARNGNAMPKHIMDKIMKNQQKAKENDSGGEKEEN